MGELRADFDQYECTGKNLIRLYEDEIRRFTELEQQATTQSAKVKYKNLIQERYSFIDRVEMELSQQPPNVVIEEPWWRKIFLTR
jgi:hypothetical protein